MPGTEPSLKRSGKRRGHPRCRRAWTSAPGTDRREWSTSLQGPRDISLIGAAAQSTVSGMADAQNGEIWLLSPTPFLAGEAHRRRPFLENAFSILSPRIRRASSALFCYARE